MKKSTFILILIALLLFSIGSMYYAYKVNDIPAIEPAIPILEEKESHVDGIMPKELKWRKQCNK